MSHYEKHIFFCTNFRENGKVCCAKGNAEAMLEHAKRRVREAGLLNIRVNKAGCLGRCESGPAMVIYPEAIWYRYANEQDIDEIIEKHVNGDQIIRRLEI